MNNDDDGTLIRFSKFEMFCLFSGVSGLIIQFKVQTRVVVESEFIGYFKRVPHSAVCSILVDLEWKANASVPLQFNIEREK